MRPSQPNARRATALVLVLALSALAACRASEPNADADSGPQVAIPWRAIFPEPQFLLADEVRIEGSKPLLEHLATSADDSLHVQVVETRPEGFYQEFTVRPGIGGGSEIRAVLDQLEIRAARKLIVLERPGYVPTSVRGIGNAWWSDAKGSRELREAMLMLPRDADRARSAEAAGALPPNGR